MKIGISKDGLAQTHIFFDRPGFAYHAAPEGEHLVHATKVIAARAFAPATTV